MKSKLLIAACFVASSALFAQDVELVLNGGCDDHQGDKSVATEGDANDNADAFDMTPPSNVLDNDTGAELDSPYTWSNSDLDAALDLAYGDDSEQPGSTSDGTYVGGTKTRGVKIGETSRRLYQEITVVAGEDYTFSIDSRSEAANVPSEVFMLNKAISGVIIDTDASTNADVDHYFVISNDENSSKGSADTNTFTTNSFTFTATTSTVIIYVRALAAVDSSNEVFYDNISLVGPAPTLSANELSATDFAIYPNPASDVVNIDSKIEITSVSVYNLLGATVYSSNDFNGSVDVSGLNAGIYILNIESNGKTLSKKLVIQ